MYPTHLLSFTNLPYRIVILKVRSNSMMGEQISNPTFAKPTLDKLSKSMSNVKVKHSDSHSRSNFKVHKFLLSFAIPLDQFSDLPLNRDHTIHVSVIIVNPVSLSFIMLMVSLTLMLMMWCWFNLQEADPHLGSENTITRSERYRPHWFCHTRH